MRIQRQFKKHRFINLVVNLSFIIAQDFDGIVNEFSPRLDRNAAKSVVKIKEPEMFVEAEFDDDDDDDLFKM